MRNRFGTSKVGAKVGAKVVARVVVPVTIVLLVAAAAVLGVAWTYAGQILTPAPYALMPEFELGLVEGPLPEAEDDPNGPEGERYLVTLPRHDGPDPPQFARVDARGSYGLLWEDGAGRLGAIVADTPQQIRREVRVTHGAPPREGAPARLDVTLAHTDPSAVGVPFREVRIDGDLGPLPGWWTLADPERATLVLHGRRRADRSEALRIAPTLAASGASVLITSYRNHDLAPPSPDGAYHYGASEADDALAAIAWLQERGVREVAVVGFSMGASVAIGALLRWPEDGLVPVGLMMEAPLVDPRTVFERAARDMGLPAAGPWTRLATWIAGRRVGVDFGALDRRRVAAELTLPTLVIAGDADGTVPIALIDDFAARLPNVLYVRLDGVEHMEGWNADPQRYEAAVRAFLERIWP
ncbi:MAG: hypothetical protein WD336_06680 [Trueperaceae bacterium]